MRQIKAYLPKDSLERQGSTLEEVSQALHQALERFIQKLNSLTEDELITPIGEGRWSPAEYADHLYRATLLYRNIVERACRGDTPAEFARGWLREDGRMITVKEGEPVPGRARNDLIRDIQSSTAELVSMTRCAASVGALERVCSINPYFGPLTPLECLQLASVHAQHHTRRHLSGGNRA